MKLLFHINFVYFLNEDSWPLSESCRIVWQETCRLFDINLIELRSRLWLMYRTLRSFLWLLRIALLLFVHWYFVLIIRILLIDLEMTIPDHHCNWSVALKAFIASNTILICLPEYFIDILIRMTSSSSHRVCIIFSRLSWRILFSWIHGQLLARNYNCATLLSDTCIIFLRWINIIHHHWVSLLNLNSVVSLV